MKHTATKIIEGSRRRFYKVLGGASCSSGDSFWSVYGVNERRAVVFQSVPRRSEQNRQNMPLSHDMEVWLTIDIKGPGLIPSKNTRVISLHNSENIDAKFTGSVRIQNLNNIFLPNSSDLLYEYTV